MSETIHVSEHRAELTQSTYACRDCGEEWYADDGAKPCPQCHGWDIAEVEE